MIAVNVNECIRDSLNRLLDRFEVFIHVYFLDPRRFIKIFVRALKRTIYGTLGRKNATERAYERTLFRSIGVIRL
jgi:hypothetical protein